MLTVTVTFPKGVYEASDFDASDLLEWPPPPARLFCAFVASAQGEEHWEALRWLEDQDPPSVEASQDRDILRSERTAFVPTNQIKSGSSYGSHILRTAKGPRTWPRVMPRNPTVTYCWDVEPPAEVLLALQELARLVPYLGRSTSSAVVSADVGVPDDAEGDTRVTLVPTAGAAGRPLGVPYAGYLEDLSRAHDDGVEAFTVPRLIVGYGMSDADGLDEEPLPSPWGELWTLRILRRRLSPAMVLATTSQLRRAVMSHIDGGGTVLHGHPDPAAAQSRWHQVAFLALPFAGFENAGGQVMAVGMALPRSISPSDRSETLRGLDAVRKRGLEVPGLGKVQLSADLGEAWTVQPQRWKGPKRTWTSVFPIVLDRYLRARDPEAREQEIRAALVEMFEHLELPRPRIEEVSKYPLVPGGVRLMPHQLVRRRGEKARPAVHARFSFEEPVEGPLLLGNLRYYGLGLCMPEDQHERTGASTGAVEGASHDG